jgi:hypothetical protein
MKTPDSPNNYQRAKIAILMTGSGFKTSDQVQGQGVPRIASGAYT